MCLEIFASLIQLNLEVECYFYFVFVWIGSYFLLYQSELFKQEASMYSCVVTILDIRQVLHAIHLFDFYMFIEVFIHILYSVVLR